MPYNININLKIEGNYGFNKEINYSWTTIIRKMQSMQTSIVSVNNNNNEKIYVKLFTVPIYKFFG